MREILGYREAVLHDLLRPFAVKGVTKRLAVQVLKRFIKSEAPFDAEFESLLVRNFKERAVYKPYCAVFKKWAPTFIRECKDTHFQAFLATIYGGAKEIRGQYSTELASIEKMKERIKKRKQLSKRVQGDLDELVAYLTKQNEFVTKDVK